MGLSKDERDKVNNLASDLLMAFNWEDSPQGEDYWCTVHDNLKELVANPYRDVTQDDIGEVVEYRDGKDEKWSEGKLIYIAPKMFFPFSIVLHDDGDERVENFKYCRIKDNK